MHEEQGCKWKQRSLWRLQLSKTWGYAGPIKFSHGSGSLREGKGWPKPSSLLERGMPTGTSVILTAFTSSWRWSGWRKTSGCKFLRSQSFSHPPSVWKTCIEVLGDWVLGCLMTLVSQIFIGTCRKTPGDCHSPENVCPIQRKHGCCSVTELSILLHLSLAPQVSPSGAGLCTQVWASGRWSTVQEAGRMVVILAALTTCFFPPPTFTPGLMLACILSSVDLDL